MSPTTVGTTGGGGSTRTATDRTHARKFCCRRASSTAAQLMHAASKPVHGWPPFHRNGDKASRRARRGPHGSAGQRAPERRLAAATRPQARLPQTSSGSLSISSSLRPERTGRRGRGPEWSGRPGVPAPAMTWSRYRGRSTTPRVEVDTIALVGRHWRLKSEGFHCPVPNLTHSGNPGQSVPLTCRFAGLRSLNAHSPV